MVGLTPQREGSGYCVEKGGLLQPLAPLCRAGSEQWSHLSEVTPIVNGGGGL